MKHNIENSLKRFLKRKVKITMGFVVAFMIMGTGAFGVEYTEPIIASGMNNIVENNDDSIKLNISDWNETDNKNNSINYGIASVNNGKANINSKNIEIFASNTEEIHPNKNRYSYGVIVQDNGIVNLGTKETESIKITTISDYFGIGLYADKGNNTGGKINVNTNKLEINVIGKGKEGDAYGIYSITRTTNEAEENLSNISINAKDTVINVKSEQGKAIGIAAWSQGQVKINDGNVRITADQLISTRGKAVTEINKNNNADYIIDLKGDIAFQYASNSGTPVDADVTINLANSQSKFTGKIFSEKTSGTPGEGDLDYDGMILGLSNGGEWENTGNSFINNLTLNGGVVTNKGTDYDIKVDKLLGTGGDINMVAEIGKDGTAISGKLAIDKVENNNAKFNVNYSGEGKLEVSQEEAKKVFDDLAKNITVGEGNTFNANAKLEQGLISREYEAEFVKGKGDDVIVKPETVKVGNLNVMVEGMRDLATINVLSWRQEMSSLNERMGELRNSTGSNGIWARVYGGKVENDSKYDNEYQTYQVGYDKKYSVENGDLFVGALVSYTDGKTNYNLGDGENYSVGAGVYATWLNKDGQFADVVLKQSRLHNKFDVRSKNGNLSQHGDYSNWGTSLSGQYGRRFDLDDKFFVEPSVQLTFGRVSSEDYTTSAGVKVEQDTAYTLVGDMGTAVGYKFSNKGNVYARASLVKEFKGDIDTKYSYDGATEYTSEDLSDTWVEFGVGVNYRVKENVNMYVDIQRTEEATVENKWQANLGFRWEF